MAGARLPKSEKRLEKALFTLLGRRPFDGGLILGDGGWVALKDVALGLRGMEGMPTVSVPALERFFSVYRPERFELSGDMVRVRPDLLDQELLHPSEVVPPRVLYAGARERSLLHVADKGLWPGREGWVVLHSSERAARRWKELRTSPVAVIKVLALEAHRGGVEFFAAGPEMFLCAGLEARWLEVPPLPEPPRDEKRAKKEVKERAPEPPLLPGSFILQDGGLFEKPRRSRKKGRRKG